MAIITTTIGTRSVENVSISSVTGSDPYTVNLASAVSSTDNGDSLQDEHSTPRSYLITAGAGTDTLTVSDSTGVGAAPDDSGTSQATTTRYYSTVSTWISGLVAGDLYSGTGDDPIGHLMDDGSVFSEDNLSINNNAVGDITLTSPSGHRHDGTAGTGATIQANSTATQIIQTKKSNVVEVSWLELDGNSESVERGIAQVQNVTTPPNYRHLLVHGGGKGRWGGFAICQKAGSGGSLRVNRCIVYEWTYTGGLDGYDMVGISAENANSSRLGEINNCTVWSIEHGGAKSGYGIETLDHANKVCKNNIAIDCDTDYVLSSPSSADYDYNCSSDSSAAGSNSLTSKTAANNFVSTSAPVDLHLASGADCIGQGLDLGSSYYVEFDIDNYDVSSDAAWDIGADQVVAAFKAAWARFSNYIVGANKAGD